MDRVTELRDDDEILDGALRGLNLSTVDGGVVTDQASVASAALVEEAGPPFCKAARA